MLNRPSFKPLNKRQVIYLLQFMHGLYDGPIVWPLSFITYVYTWHTYSQTSNTLKSHVSSMEGKDFG